MYCAKTRCVCVFRLQVRGKMCADVIASNAMGESMGVFEMDLNGSSNFKAPGALQSPANLTLETGKWLCTSLNFWTLGWSDRFKGEIRGRWFRKALHLLCTSDSGEKKGGSVQPGVRIKGGCPHWNLEREKCMCPSGLSPFIPVKIQDSSPLWMLAFHRVIFPTKGSSKKLVRSGKNRCTT